MSYILDALRKAEQKRQLAAQVPTLATIHRQPVAVHPPIRLRLWPWVVGAAIVANAGIATWLLLPAGTRSTTSLAGPGSSATPDAAAPSVSGSMAARAPAPLAAPPAAVNAPTTSAPGKPLREATPPTPRVAAPPVPASQPSTEPGRVAVKAAEPKSGARAAPTQAGVGPDQPRVDQKKPPATVGPVPTAAAPIAGKPVAAPRPPAAAAPERAVPSPDRPVAATLPPPNQARPAERAQGSPGAAPQDTPQAMQDILSKLKLQMVVYSDVPSERLVFINNQKYVEGSSIDGSLRVESINPDSAVLSHQGRRFLIRQ